MADSTAVSAAGIVMFHVSPAANHDSIAVHGLDAARNPRGGYAYTGEVAGQYLFGDRRSAIAAAERDFVGAHVYAVDVTGLDTAVDPRMPDAYVVGEPIDATRVQLLGHTRAHPDSTHGYRFIPAT